jgi:hypothetical protein
MLLDGALWEDIAINFQVLTQYGTSLDFFFVLLQNCIQAGSYKFHTRRIKYKLMGCSHLLCAWSDAALDCKNN